TRLAIGTTDQVLRTANGLDPSWGKLVRANTNANTGTGDTFVFATSPAFLTGISVTSAAAIVNTADTYLVQAAVSATSDGSTGGVLKVFGISGTLTQNV